MQARQNSKRAHSSSESDRWSTGTGGDISDDEPTLDSHATTSDAESWTKWLTALSQPIDADIIQQCEGVDITKLISRANEYLDLADSKLHVFPFKDVHPCWHRLYTDTSIIKAVKIVQSSMPDKNMEDMEWFDQVVNILDTAMIMTGGYGREGMLQGIYRQLEDTLHNCQRKLHQSKKIKPNDLLSSDEHSIPKLECPVQDRFDRPTLQTFEQFMHKKKPALLTKTFDHWPALKRWQKLTYWRQLTLGGRRLVPIEIGRSYVDDDWSQKIVPFEQFLDEYISDESKEKGYLAQYDLFHHLPKLNRDVATPDYCFLGAPLPDPEIHKAKTQMKSGLKKAKLEVDEVQKNIWFGPAWTISPLHHDPYHNILCQTVGKKYVRLYCPGFSSKLYPRADDEVAPHGDGTIDMSNTSSIDVAAMELSPDEDWDEKWPGVSKVPYEEVILEPGQALYIPIGWWHYVRSCSVGISVSFWW